MDVLLLMLGSAVSVEGWGLRFSGYLSLGIISALGLVMASILTYGLLFLS